jgi:hypothetical protein
MVVLGCAAGLVLLPVLLSLTGPLRGVEGDDELERADQHDSVDSKVDEDKERADGENQSSEVSV